eukprot:3855814-Pyramimonas_sp.AAC.1
MGAAKHQLCQQDVDLYRGLKCLVKEPANWAAYLEVHLQGPAEQRLDTVGLGVSEKCAPDSHELPPQPEPEILESVGGEG